MDHGDTIIVKGTVAHRHSERFLGFHVYVTEDENDENVAYFYDDEGNVHGAIMASAFSQCVDAVSCISIYNQHEVKGLLS